MNKIFSSKNFPFVLMAILLPKFSIMEKIPFFGDAISSTARAVQYIFDQNLLTIFYPIETDPAHPTLYPWLMAACWKFFGRSLLVSHLYAYFWYLFLIFIFYKIAKLFIVDNVDVNKTLLLFIAMPTALSMSAMMLNTTAVMAFFLLAIYSLLTKNNKLFLVSTILMMLTHMQAPFFLLALAATDFFLSMKEKSFIVWFKERFVFYVLPFAVLVAWLTLHYLHTGWLVLSPNYSDADKLNGFSQYAKSLLLMAWRLVDFGMITFYIIFIYALFKKLGDKKLQQVWLILAIVICGLMAIFLENTIGHRYFLVLGLMMIIIVMNALQYFAPRQKNILYVLLLLSLVFGNFLYYPGKTIGDGNLVYLGYINLAKTIKNDFSDTTVFYSYAPIANPSQLMYLNDEGLKTERINGQNLDSIPAIIQSNLNAEFSESDKQYLAQHFYGKSYTKGAVYVNVFLNPKFYKKPEGWKLREPSGFENWMIEMKAKIKN